MTFEVSKYKLTARTKFDRANQQEELPMMPLTTVRPGETVTIRRITGRDQVRQHLAELGFVVDSDVTVVNEIAGSLILQVKNGRIALDSQMANRILY